RPHSTLTSLFLSLPFFTFPLFFLFTAPSPTEIYTLSLHDALPILERVPMSFRNWRGWGLALLLACSGLGLPCLAMADGVAPPHPAELACPPPPADHPERKICFNMVSANACLPNARGRVRIRSVGQ